MTTRTLSEVIDAARPGDELDLSGETLIGDVVNISKPVSIFGAAIVGQSTIFDPVGISFDNCRFTDSGISPIKGLLVMLGGNGFRVRDCSFAGGRTAGQLSIGLNDRHRGSIEAFPRNWLVTGCTFAKPSGLWGTYPQVHNVYCLADPTYSQNGEFRDCFFHSLNLGAGVKLGGTGFQPYTEGSRGISMTDCTFVAEPAPPEVDSTQRAQCFLAQGRKTDVTLVRPTFRVVPTEGDPRPANMLPWVTVRDGARVRIFDARFPYGICQDVTWYELFGLWKRSSKMTVARNVGGLTWE